MFDCPRLRYTRAVEWEVEYTEDCIRQAWRVAKQKLKSHLPILIDKSSKCLPKLVKF